MNLAFFDTVRRKTISALFQHPVLREQLVFKGGAHLELALRVGARSSLDLDFSIEHDFASPQELRDNVESALRPAFARLGFEVLDVRAVAAPPSVTADLEDFWGGYAVEFKLLATQHAASVPDEAARRRRAVPLKPDRSTIFRVDISKYEYCGGKQEFLIDDSRIFGYSAEMTIAEKLRAICQQMPEYRALVHKQQAGRARDFFDIYNVTEVFLINFANPAFQDVVRRVFEAKRVPLTLLPRISERRDDHRPDFAGLAATVGADVRLEGFDFYVDYVVRRCAALEPLGYK